MEQEGNHSPQEVGGKGVEGQVVWGEVVDYKGGVPFCWVGGGGGGWSLPWRLKGSKGGRAGETRRKQRDTCTTLPW